MRTIANATPLETQEPEQFRDLTRSMIWIARDSANVVAENVGCLTHERNFATPHPASSPFPSSSSVVTSAQQRCNGYP